ncbi:methylenetetrahydrofolate reductase [Streptomyces sp. NPDC007851]|uniref:methylenetetrahydrofolate reductase n=1 Tax=Streptomyces sp. NPDC007851 TaxID=3155008 RepID=UPI00340FCA95
MHSSTDQTGRQGPAGLLDTVSLEITGKDVKELRSAAAQIPPGTRVNITFLGNESMALRVEAARVVRELGFRPVPHVSARRLRSQEDLKDYLAALAEAEAVEEIVVIGGDPPEPEGPFPDALSVISTGLLGAHGVRQVNIAGYPEGHPKIDDDVLWQAVEQKWAALREQNLACSVTTQFGFDTGPVVAWIEKLRAREIDSPIRVGVPGPAGVQRLLRYARRFGVQSSASVVQKYGLSLTGLLGTAGPNRFVESLESELDTDRHGDVSLHFYTFGGVRATAEWIQNARHE